MADDDDDDDPVLNVRRKIRTEDTISPFIRSSSLLSGQWINTRTNAGSCRGSLW